MMQLYAYAVRGRRRTFFTGAFTLIEMLVVMAIITTLAGLLLPSLATAREKGRRIACLNNLSQISKGLETYCGAYSEYFPSHSAYGASPCTRLDSPYLLGWDDDGWYADRDGARIRTNSTLDYFNHNAAGNLSFRGMVSAPTRYRTVFIGDRALSWLYDDVIGGVRQRFDPYPGRLNLAPQGLGCLVAGNDMPEAQLLYCPSSAGSMPLPASCRNVPSDFAGQDGCTSIARMKAAAGSFDGKAIMYGDWRNLGYFSTAYDKCRVVFSDYAYRGTPIALLGAFESELPPYPEPWTPEKLARIRLEGTKPWVYTQVAAPPFKTQRLLGPRAIVADSFGRGHDGSHASLAIAAPQAPGDGEYAHKDGYNVLYGDGRVVWVGDPLQRYIYWREINANALVFQTPNLVMDASILLSTQGSGLSWWRMENGQSWSAWDSEIDDGESWDNIPTCGAAVWHDLDVQAGVDVDAR